MADGIGSGIAMRLVGDHTLGREESKAAALLKSRDYCKMHIVCHHLRSAVPASLTLPEVPLGTRLELLRLATEVRFPRVAAFASGEAPEALSNGMLENVDVLALNQGEARAFARLDGRDRRAFD